MTTDSRPPAGDDDGQWRDEGKLPLEELVQAVATSSNEGQMDDRTGNDAGIERPPTAPDDHDPDPQTLQQATTRWFGWTGRQRVPRRPGTKMSSDVSSRLDRPCSWW